MPFVKGQSGNPGGRPAVVAEVRKLARAHTATALRALVEIVSNQEAPPAARVSAANSILDRGYGRPSQAIEASLVSKQARECSDEELLAILSAGKVVNSD